MILFWERASLLQSSKYKLERKITYFTKFAGWNNGTTNILYSKLHRGLYDSHTVMTQPFQLLTEVKKKKKKLVQELHYFK
jgi:hypothetical protein